MDLDHQSQALQWVHDLTLQPDHFCRVTSTPQSLILSAGAFALKLPNGENGLRGRGIAPPYACSLIRTIGAFALTPPTGAFALTVPLVIQFI